MHSLRKPPWPSPRPTVDIAVPVYNEQDALAHCVTRLRHEAAGLPWDITIVIIDNASTDHTPRIGATLADLHVDIRYRRLESKGRGRALRAAWMESDADLCVYMDVDLSTDLAALAPALAVLESGHSDVCIGSRLIRGAHVSRGLKREVVSRCYNTILKVTLGARYSDAQCGFKAITRDAARALLPYVQDNEWFFDTELLTLAQWAGLRIHEIPVDWIDDPVSSVDIVSTAKGDLRGILRMTRTRMEGGYPLAQMAVEATSRTLPDGPRLGLSGQLLSFCLIGVLSTVGFALLYLLGSLFLAPQVANFGALLATALANTAANRRVTFGIRGPEGASRHQGKGLIVFAIGWGLTAGGLATLHTADPEAGRLVELGVLLVANGCATLLRFLLFRHWVFRGHNHIGHVSSSGPRLTVTTNTDEEESAS